jgi:hypothetical protein
MKRTLLGLLGKVPRGFFQNVSLFLGTSLQALGAELPASLGRANGTRIMLIAAIKRMEIHLRTMFRFA